MIPHYNWSVCKRLFAFITLEAHFHDSPQQDSAKFCDKIEQKSDPVS